MEYNIRDFTKTNIILYYIDYLFTQQETQNIICLLNSIFIKTLMVNFGKQSSLLVFTH